MFCCGLNRLKLKVRKMEGKIRGFKFDLKFPEYQKHRDS
ncbi:hypothetical protein LEP1GSC172_1628 [Leptospira noguchii]|uniref:Uncharacterized protein n=1 Tax=Leptospira noguchii TaxID=28182 RepID=M6W237_9LEPT|nr:hypothetical protein LEP1GSC172_1628 [Leptospira noguchii]